MIRNFSNFSNGYRELKIQNAVSSSAPRLQCCQSLISFYLLLLFCEVDFVNFNFVIVLTAQHL